MTVTVTVTGGKVTAVQVDASAETPDLGGKAAETLAAQLTQTGSTAGVDAITAAPSTPAAHGCKAPYKTQKLPHNCAAVFVLVVYSITAPVQGRRPWR